MRHAICLLTLILALPLAAETTLIDRGRAALNRNEPEAAADLLEKAVVQSPNSAEAHFLLGRAYGTLAQQASIFKQAGLAKKTRLEFERAVQLDSNHTDARWGLLEYYMIAPGFMGGDETKAIEQANEIKMRDLLKGHRAFAFIYNRQKKPDLMRKEYLDMVREQPNSPASHYWLGYYYFAFDKNYKSATDEFEASLKLDETFMPSLFQLGHVAALWGANLQRGEEALHKYLAYTPKENEPALYRAHFWLGAIYEKQGKKAEARQSYGTSLRLNPGQKDVAGALKRVS